MSDASPTPTGDPTGDTPAPATVYESYASPTAAIKAAAAWKPTGVPEVDAAGEAVAATISDALGKVATLDDPYLPEDKRAAALAALAKTVDAVTIDGTSAAIDAARAATEARLLGARTEPTRELLARQDLDLAADHGGVEEVVAEDVVAARLVLTSYGERWAKSHDMDLGDLARLRTAARATLATAGDPLQKEAGRVLATLDGTAPRMADLAWAAHAARGVIAKSRDGSRRTLADFEARR